MAYLNGQKILLGSNVTIANLPIDQDYNPESENAQSGIAVAQAVSGKADKEKWELIETVSVTEEAVVQRTYDKYYKKILIWAFSTEKLPKFRLINSANSLYWEFYSYAANTYSNLRIFGEAEVNLYGDAIFSVETIVGNNGGNPSKCLPIIERLGPLTAYNYGFNGFKTDGACKAGTTIKIYGVKA